VVDPFEFQKRSHIANDPTLRAPAEAVDAWTGLAEQARAELERMGFAAAVTSGEMPFGTPTGARVAVHAMYPFGVILDWRTPLQETDRYREEVVPGPVAPPLLEYVVTSKEIITRALLDVLKEARFRVLIDHEGRQAYHYRVLGAPNFPLV